MSLWTFVLRILQTIIAGHQFFFQLISDDSQMFQYRMDVQEQYCNLISKSFSTRLVVKMFVQVDVR